jgi:hypothetical protein
MARSASSKQVPLLGPDSLDPETGATTGGGHPTHSPLAFILAKQLRQPRDVGGNLPGLVLRRDLGLQRLGLAVSGVDVHERCPLAVADDIAARDIVDAQGAGNSTSAGVNARCPPWIPMWRRGARPTYAKKLTVITIKRISGRTL